MLGGASFFRRPRQRYVLGKHMGFRRPKTLKVVPYEVFRREEAVTGLLGVVSGNSPMSELIKRATKSDYSHVFMFGWANEDCLMVAEAWQPSSRVISARVKVREDSGLIDVYKVKQDVDLKRAWNFMLRFSGVDYPEEWIINNWLRIHFGGKVDPYPNSSDPEVRRHCSGAVHAALCLGGMTPICDYDSDVFPDYWADPSLTTYLCTVRK